MNQPSDIDPAVALANIIIFCSLGAFTLLLATPIFHTLAFACQEVRAFLAPLWERFKEWGERDADFLDGVPCEWISSDPVDAEPEAAPVRAESFESEPAPEVRAERPFDFAYYRAFNARQSEIERMEKN